MIERPKPNWNLKLKRIENNRKVDKSLSMEQAEFITGLLKPQATGALRVREAILKKKKKKYPEYNLDVNLLNQFRANNPIRLEAEGAPLGTDRMGAISKQRGKSNYRGPEGNSRVFIGGNFNTHKEKDPKEEK